MRMGVACAVFGSITVAGCGGGDDVALPMVERIPEAVTAIETAYGAPQEYFEIAARLDSITYVVAVDDATAAEQGSWTPAGGLVGPEAAGEASGATFTADQIDLDPDRIFDQVIQELDEPAIVDLAAQGSGDGGVIYDASIASDSGGVLLVLLGPDGSILAVQGQ